MIKTIHSCPPGVNEQGKIEQISSDTVGLQELFFQNAFNMQKIGIYWMKTTILIDRMLREKIQVYQNLQNRKETISKLRWWSDYSPRTSSLKRLKCLYTALKVWYKKTALLQTSQWRHHYYRSLQTGRSRRHISGDQRESSIQEGPADILLMISRNESAHDVNIKIRGWQVLLQGAWMTLVEDRFDTPYRIDESSSGRGETSGRIQGGRLQTAA